MVASGIDPQRLNLSKFRVLEQGTPSAIREPAGNPLSGKHRRDE
jgi:hypothetical protein